MTTLHRRISGNLFVTAEKQDGKWAINVTTARSDRPASAAERDRALHAVLEELSELGAHIRRKELASGDASER